MTRHAGWILRKDDLDSNQIIFLFFQNPKINCILFREDWLESRGESSLKKRLMKLLLVSTKEESLGINFKVTFARELKFNPYPTTWTCKEANEIWTLKKKTNVEFVHISLWLLTDCWKALDWQGVSRGLFYTRDHEWPQSWPARRPQASLGKRLLSKIDFTSLQINI